MHFIWASTDHLTRSLDSSSKLKQGICLKVTMWMSNCILKNIDHLLSPTDIIQKSTNVFTSNKQ